MMPLEDVVHGHIVPGMSKRPPPAAGTGGWGQVCRVGGEGAGEGEEAHGEGEGGVAVDTRGRGERAHSHTQRFPPTIKAGEDRRVLCVARGASLRGSADNGNGV